MKDSEFIAIHESMPNGSSSWNAQAFGGFGGIYRYTLNVVHLLNHLVNIQSFQEQRFRNLHWD